MADEESDFTEVQESRFRTLQDQLSERGIMIPLHHLYNSPGSCARISSATPAASVFLFTDYTRPDTVERRWRRGFPSFTPTGAHVENSNRAGQACARRLIGEYGGTYRTKRKEALAILPIGHFDGYDRGLSNKADVLIRGKRCPSWGACA